MKKIFTCCILLFFALANYAIAQDYTTVGSAAVGGSSTEFVITPDLNNQTGAVWANKPLDLTKCFKIKTQLNFGVTDALGADGIAFLLSAKHNITGTDGGSLGYVGITPAIDIEFDDWQNTETGPPPANDPVEDHVAFTRNGDTHHPNGYSILPNIENNIFIDATFSWDPATKTLSVEFLGHTYSHVESDITTFLGSSTVYFGFTAATGGAKNLQQVRINSVQNYCEAPCKVTVTTTPVPYCLCGVKGSATLTFTGKAPFKYTITPCNISGKSSDNTETINNLNAGNYTVKVTDATGCVSTATFTISVTPPITASIDVKSNISFPGQKANTIYLGYTPQYLTLTAKNVQGGTPPYTYKWYFSNGLSTPDQASTKATPTCSTIYTLVITDSKGCRFYKCVLIKVVDVRCGKYNTQVEICYKGKTLCVDKTLVAGYLSCGATLGTCGCDKDDDDDKDGWWDDSKVEATVADDATGLAAPVPDTKAATIGAYPNPTGGVFRVTVQALNVPAQVMIADAKGKAISTTSRPNTTSAGQTFEFNLSTQPAGMYLVHVMQGQLRSTYKVFVVR